jgi:hypothetical protein
MKGVKNPLVGHDVPSIDQKIDLSCAGKELFTCLLFYMGVKLGLSRKESNKG